jgi:hypothetical protein
LQVELGLPGEVYRGARFDWTGFITRVTLDGTHTFCVPESYQAGTGTGGIGLCNEFGIDQPVGYGEARPGEFFPKLGIGLLRRLDESPYSFACPYEVARPFPVDLEHGVDWARVIVEPVECQGYAVRLVKTFQVAENRLEISYSLANTGLRPVVTHEYVHNFIGIDQQPLGPGYLLRFPYPVVVDPQMTSGLDSLTLAGHDVHFSAAAGQGLYFRAQPAGRSEQPQWEMWLQASGVGVREYDDFAPLRVAVWGTAHVLSPEIFVPIDLPPGTSQTWRRRFEFLS